MIKIDKFFGNKKNTTIIYLLVAMGILLIILGNAPEKVPATTQPTVKTTRASEAESILTEIKGAGVVRVMISEEKQKDEAMFSGAESEKGSGSCSALIVADGGADSVVREKIIKAASAALGIDSHKIQVFERKD